MRWRHSDGGRLAAGFKGEAGDCVVRAIAIATYQPYQNVYAELAERNKANGDQRSARNGTPRKIYEPYMFDLGWLWNPTMRIGSGCQVHMRADELPDGPLVVRLSGHLSAVIDGIVYDTHDPTRDGTRCVYGYYLPGLNV